MENLIIALNCVLPVFLMLAVGYIARLSRIVPQDCYKHISRLSFTYLLPLLLFQSVYASDFRTSFNGRLMLFVSLSILAVFLLSFGILSFFVKDRRVLGALVQVCYRTNIVILGMSMMAAISDEAGCTTMAMAISFATPMNNVTAVILLEKCRGGKAPLGKTILNVLKNPLIIAALAAALLQLFRISLPEAVMSAVKSLGTGGTVMTLIALGATLDFTGMRRNLRRIVWGTFVKLVFVPLLVVGTAILMDFRGAELAVILFTVGTPLAAASFPMAQVYDSDYELTGQLVVTTSLFCCLTLFFWVFALKELGFI